MSLSIISQKTSSTFHPVANAINVTVNSNNSGNCNYRYICDIYVNNVRVFRDKLSPDPSTGYGFFQTQRIIQDYIENLVPKTPYTDNFNLASGSSAPTGLLTVYFKFGEEYDSSSTCDGDVAQYLNLATSNTIYVFNGAINYEDFPTWDYTDYKVGTASATTLFLTNTPREIEVTYNDSFFLDFLSLVTIDSNINIKYTGWRNGTPNVQTYTSTTLTANKRYRIAVGPYDLNKIDTQPTINQAVDYYDIELRYGTTIISERIRFKVKPPRAFQTRVGFIGRLGSIEHFTFYHRNVTSYEVERKNFKKVLNSNYSGDWSYQVGDRSDTTYSTKTTEKHAVATFCSQDMSLWLYEMWLSPDVWVYKRPELLDFRTFGSGSSRLFYFPTGHGMVAGDSFLCFAEAEDFAGYTQQYEIISVNGNIIDVGITTGSYTTDACGWVQKVENWNRLPVIISDNNVIVKQKAGKPIEYSLSYMMAYPKITLR